MAAYDRVSPRLPAGCVRGVERFLAGTLDLRAPEAVLIHQDLGAEHVFVIEPDVTISGIIDFSDACLGDPAIDLGLILRDLGPGAAEHAVARCAAGGLASRGLSERAEAYARFRTLEDLAFGLRHGRGDYWTNAVRAAVRLFGHG